MAEARMGSDTIFLITQAGERQRVGHQLYASEDILQQLVANTPTCWRAIRSIPSRLRAGCCSDVKRPFPIPPEHGTMSGASRRN